MLAIAVDSLTDTVIDGYRDLGLLADGATAASRSPRRASPSWSSGARAAAARGARIYGELARLRHDLRRRAASGTERREGEGVERAMRVALEMRASAAQIAARVGERRRARSADAGEAADRRVFAARRAIAPKLSLGEPIGAGGSLNAALALRAGSARDRSPRGSGAGQQLPWRHALSIVLARATARSVDPVDRARSCLDRRHLGR